MIKLSSHLEYNIGFSLNDLQGTHLKCIEYTHESIHLFCPSLQCCLQENFIMNNTENLPT